MDYIPKNRKLYFSDKVDAKTMKELIQGIDEINDHDDVISQHIKMTYKLDYVREPIEIYIDSPGGYVYNLWGLIGVIEKSKAPIHTIATGMAMSCGAILLLAGEKRYAYRHATVMIHSAAQGMGGKVKDVEETVEQLKIINDKINNYIISKSKMTKKQIKDIYEKKQDYFIDAKKALQLGIIDDIV